MKKLIGALVGAIILFIWQFLSWGPLNIHVKEMDYTPAQDQILNAIEEAGIPPGQYFLPRTPLDMPSGEAQEARAKTIGKPWAVLQYHGELKNTMGMNLLRGFVVDFLGVYLMVWLLLNFAEVTMSKTVLACIAVGLIGYFTVSYLEHIWFETLSIPALIDAIIPWSIMGAWLGWWLRR